MCTYSKTSTLIQSISKKLYLLSQNYPQKLTFKKLYPVIAEEFKSNFAIEITSHQPNCLNFELLIIVEHPILENKLLCCIQGASLSNLFAICQQATILEGIMLDCLENGVNFLDELPFLDKRVINFKLKDFVDTDEDSDAIEIEHFIEFINEVIIDAILPEDERTSEDCNALSKIFNSKYPTFISYSESQIS